MNVHFVHFETVLELHSEHLPKRGEMLVTQEELTSQFVTVWLIILTNLKHTF